MKSDGKVCCALSSPALKLNFLSLSDGLGISTLVSLINFGETGERIICPYRSAMEGFRHHLNHFTAP